MAKAKVSFESIRKRAADRKGGNKVLASLMPAKPDNKAMAKLNASEAAARICDQAARVLASYGYAMEYPVQRYLRDVRFTLIGGGTSEILKLIVAKELCS